MRKSEESSQREHSKEAGLFSSDEESVNSGAEERSEGAQRVDFDERGEDGRRADFDAWSQGIPDDLVLFSPGEEEGAAGRSTVSGSMREDSFSSEEGDSAAGGGGPDGRREDYDAWSQEVSGTLTLNYESRDYQAPEDHRKSFKEEKAEDGAGRRAARDSRGRRKGRWRRVLAGIAIGLAAIIAVVAIAWQVLTATGRASLLKSSGTIHLVGEDGTVYENWEDDWVAYDGHVYDYNEDIMTFLLMGIDKTSEVQPGEDAYDGGSADALYLVIMDQSTKEISLLYINRYTMVDVYVYDEDGNFLYTENMQICLQHYVGDGMEQSAEREVMVVSELLYDLPINGYASINMCAIPLFNDAVGGVTLEALEDVPVTRMLTSGREQSIATYDESEITRDLTAGETYTLNGMEAYYYLKFRDVNKSMSSFGRADRQKQYIKLFVEQMIDAVKSDLSVALDLYNALSSYMVTDVSLSEFSYLISEMLDGYTFHLDEYYQIEGELLTGDTESGYYELYVDEDALYELMLEIFYVDVTEEAVGTAS